MNTQRNDIKTFENLLIELMTNIFDTDIASKQSINKKTRKFNKQYENDICEYISEYDNNICDYVYDLQNKNKKTNYYEDVFKTINKLFKIKNKINNKNENIKVFENLLIELIINVFDTDIISKQSINKKIRKINKQYENEICDYIRDSQNESIMQLIENENENEFINRYQNVFKTINKLFKIKNEINNNKI